jgi:hypothetical protein
MERLPVTIATGQRLEPAVGIDPTRKIRKNPPGCFVRK